MGGYTAVEEDLLGGFFEGWFGYPVARAKRRATLLLFLLDRGRTGCSYYQQSSNRCTTQQIFSQGSA